MKIRVAYVEKNIEHSKYGIFLDDESNSISFNGSINESLSGWTDQSNRFKVFTSWTNRKDDLQDDIDDFEKLWKNKGLKTRTFEFPEAVKKGFFKLIDYDVEDEAAADDLISALDEEDDLELNDILKNNPLWVFQQKAIDSWEKNNRIGLLEMATGTGKTFTAIHGLIRLQRDCESLLTLIVCHSKDLCRQWEKELKKFNINASSTIGKPNWNIIIEDKIHDITLGADAHPVIITTYVTYCKDKFISALKIDDDVKKFIICDEAHTAASTQSINGLIDDYQFRLGLSATPYGYFDDIGYADRMMSFFGCKENDEGILESTFVYNLKDAIEGKWAKEPALVNYEYILHPLELDYEEMEEYRKLTAKLSWKSNGNSDKNNTNKEQFLFQRAEIIKSAKNKMPILRDIISRMNPIELLIVYHSPERQKEDVYDILDENNIVWSKFTGDESNHERENLLVQIAHKNVKALAAMKCLDQGVDVPSIRNAVICSSSGNPMTFIQRRGRVLRKFPGKDRAIIHDFIVMPPLINDSIGALEKGILKKELRRISEFSKLSLYNTEVTNIVNHISLKYKLDLRED